MEFYSLSLPTVFSSGLSTLCTDRQRKDLFISWELTKERENCTTTNVSISEVWCERIFVCRSRILTFHSKPFSVSLTSSPSSFVSVIVDMILVVNTGSSLKPSIKLWTTYGTIRCLEWVITVFSKTQTVDLSRGPVNDIDRTRRISHLTFIKSTVVICSVTP